MFPWRHIFIYSTNIANTLVVFFHGILWAEVSNFFLHLHTVLNVIPIIILEVLTVVTLLIQRNLPIPFLIGVIDNTEVIHTRLDMR
ncbi:MAG: hypothetical protein EBX99_06320 [Acidimicrobiia bacterium]|nr:hypothetical protein [Acidimicrobiia bacterium]